MRSQTTGIIFNNLMADFNIPGRHTNFSMLQSNLIEPGKRPMSSMAPTIVTSDEGVKVVLGASGGPRIPSTLAQVLQVSVLSLMHQYANSYNNSIYTPNNSKHLLRY